MHAGEHDIDPELVRRLLVAQLPQWAELPLEPVPSAGTDNALFRLGDDLAVRMPRVEGAAAQVDKEHRWLPVLAPHLPLSVPVPLARGVPGEGYPLPWSVYRWLDGEDATTAFVTDECEAAVQLAEFVGALGRVDSTGGPEPGDHNFGRGEPLERRDEDVRRALEALDGTIDTAAAGDAWAASLAAPVWDGGPVWIHGDLAPGNLLVDGGRLSAVIDFGGLGVGDPACDVMVAWTFLSPGSREVFRAALSVDDATWVRARGWALSMGLIALPYYRDTNPVLARYSRRWIDATVADHRRSAT